MDILPDTGGDAQTRMTTMSYDGDLNQTATGSYDYSTVTTSVGQTGAITSMPTGTLLRMEETTYLVNDAEFSSSQTAYRNRHLIALPTKQYVKNGAGTIVAATRITYDEGGT